MLTLKQILRASHVRRWNIVATSRDQSVAEHSFNVCMLARAMCKRLDIGDEDIIKASLEHDLDEVVFGDIPSPMKAKLMEDGINVNEYVGNVMRELSHFEWHILKTADLLDAVLFLQDHAVGSHAEEVCEEVHDRLMHHIEDCGCCTSTEGVIIKKFAVEVIGERV